MLVSTSLELQNSNLIRTEEKNIYKYWSSHCENLETINEVKTAMEATEKKSKSDKGKYKAEHTYCLADPDFATGRKLIEFRDKNKK